MLSTDIQSVNGPAVLRHQREWAQCLAHCLVVLYCASGSLHATSLSMQRPVTLTLSPSHSNRFTLHSPPTLDLVAMTSVKLFSPVGDGND